MVSFQRLFSRENEFCDLLEASVREAAHAVGALKQVLTRPGVVPTLEQFAAVRRKDKEITERINTMLVTNFVTPMEREDIEELAVSLYKIPKTVEKFAERYLIVAGQVQDVDFSRQLNLMEQAVQLVMQMVQSLRGGRRLAGVKTLQQQLQAVEAEADEVLLLMMRPFYEPGFPALKAVILRDLIDLNEKVVDRCRDAGNVVSRVILKNS
ncbi:MAG: hypothetical protein RJA22_868 [Verrucomicrobiota bacterium]|jgi:uncharacterized protein Yka (UPF0111/DUF47 family)